MSLHDRLIRWFAPSTFWIIVFLLGLGALVGWGSYTIARVSRDEAVHTSDLQARRTAAVIQCLGSRAPIHKFDQNVEGGTEFDGVLVGNARRQLRATPRSSPMHQVRLENWIRLRRAYRKELALSGGFPVPSRDECKKVGSAGAPGSIGSTGPTGPNATGLTGATGR